ncbi:hypothetical protein C7B62_05655 [Pleurocapsa sp. CCALA 161]|uniref:hypothetical protein n=1 Tax=Pleurocapsa sp. CCALA 161 TaxID=2107688 RepID=UPI000D051513|nr:hypothetical protein [Pleurocapsa sp. CCALA 161]PSB11391.1 hypothetical protein C7B62_05655 [Pleurocapsa sp. CCALA 161]
MDRATRDLAGEVCFHPNFFQTKARINYLIDRYLSYDQLGDRLEDLPRQFEHPQPRKWSIINWQDIHPEQIVGLELDIFLSIIKGALDTEAPIRDYTQTSRQYLEPIHPSMARFVGGVVEADTIIELGLWEKEERQHSPALIKLYQLLANKSVTPQAKIAKSYQPWINAYQDLYQHGLHRVITEYGAVCLYLWLMSHTTGTIQQVLGELLQDEVNHLTKFWGMGMWLYPDSTEQLIRYLLSQIHTILPVFYKSSTIKSPANIKSTFQRMMSVLNWQSWSVLERGELIYTFMWILKRMWDWSGQLTPEYLHSCCSTPKFFGNNNFERHQPKIIIS